jgi:hypothetical protein
VLSIDYANSRQSETHSINYAKIVIIVENGVHCAFQSGHIVNIKYNVNIINILTIYNVIIILTIYSVQQLIYYISMYVLSCVIKVFSPPFKCIMSLCTFKNKIRQLHLCIPTCDGTIGEW